MTIKIKDVCGKNTVTRDDGKKINDIIMRQWNAQHSIEIDFGNIVIASVSFMDEAIGILGLKFSKDEIVQKIKLKNITDLDKKLLNDVLFLRLKHHKKRAA
ncbi:MAG: STAS-like domain-containing protein [Elusimicrobia bacterium]|nr:STAS-like domain-containing protein [Elusimicrobiota bacterium]